MVGTGSLGVLDCCDRRNVVDRVRAGLAGQSMGLMAQAIARVRICRLRLIVHMPATLASEARGVVIRDRCVGDIDRRRVLRGGTVSMGRMVFLGVLDWNVLSRVRRGLARQFTRLMAQTVVAGVRISQLRLIVYMPATLSSEARGVIIRDRCVGAVGSGRGRRGGE